MRLLVCAYLIKLFVVKINAIVRVVGYQTIIFGT